MLFFNNLDKVICDIRGLKEGRIMKIYYKEYNLGTEKKSDWIRLDFPDTPINEIEKS